MTQALVVPRSGQPYITDIPSSSASPGGAAVARADTTHVDSAAVTAHVDSAAAALPAAQMSAPAASGGALILPAAADTPVPSSIQSSNPVAAAVASDSHTDTGSGGVVERGAAFELPFTHEVASGSDAVNYVMQDDGSIVVTGADSGPTNDWTIIV